MGDSVTTKVFTRWVNTVLSSAGSQLKLQDIVQEGDDGIAYSTIAEHLSSLKVGRFHKVARERFQKNYNCKMLVNFLVQQGIKLDGLDPFDIVDHNSAAVFRVVWAIAKHYQAQASESEIIQWATKIVPSLKESDIAGSWREGKYFVALLSAFSLGSIAQGDTKGAYEYAAQNLGIPQLLDPQDSPDLLSAALYLSYLRNYVTKNNLTPKSGIVTNDKPLDTKQATKEVEAEPDEDEEAEDEEEEEEEEEEEQLTRKTRVESPSSTTKLAAPISTPAKQLPLHAHSVYGERKVDGKHDLSHEHPKHEPATPELHLHEKPKFPKSEPQESQKREHSPVGRNASEDLPKQTEAHPLLSSQEHHKPASVQSIIPLPTHDQEPVTVPKEHAHQQLADKKEDLDRLNLTTDPKPTPTAHAPLVPSPEAIKPRVTTPEPQVPSRTSPEPNVVALAPRVPTPEAIESGVHASLRTSPEPKVVALSPRVPTPEAIEPEVHASLRTSQEPKVVALSPRVPTPEAIVPDVHASHRTSPEPKVALSPRVTTPEAIESGVHASHRTSPEPKVALSPRVSGHDAQVATTSSAPLPKDYIRGKLSTSAELPPPAIERSPLNKSAEISLTTPGNSGRLKTSQDIPRTPDRSMPPKSDSSVSPKPERSISPKPERTTSPKPDRSPPNPERSISPPKPERSISPKPERSVSPKPAGTTSPKPERSISPKPERSTSPKPEHSTSPKPERSISPKPDQSKSPKPDRSISPKPDISQTQERTSSPKPQDSKSHKKDKDKSKEKEAKQEKHDETKSKSRFSWLKPKLLSSSNTPSSKSPASSPAVIKRDPVESSSKNTHDSATLLEAEHSVLTTSTTQATHSPPTVHETAQASPPVMARRQTLATSSPSSDHYPRYWELPRSEPTSPRMRQKTATDVEEIGETRSVETDSPKGKRRELPQQDSAPSFVSYAAPAGRDSRKNAIGNSRSKSFVEPPTHEASRDSSKDAGELSKRAKSRESAITSRVARSLSITVMHDLQAQNSNKDQN